MAELFGIKGVSDPHTNREEYRSMLGRDGIPVGRFEAAKRGGFHDLWARLRALLKR